MQEDYLVETINYKGYDIKIYQDDYPKNPRDWGNLGTIFYAHRKYILGDIDISKLGDFNDWKEIENYLIKTYKPPVILPLYLYDHSIQHIKVGDWYGVGLPQGYAEFDTGKVGYIIAERDKVLAEYKVKRVSKKLKAQVEDILRAEVEEFDDYVSGNVYGYEVEDLDESCWGFYGDYNNYLLEDAKEVIDYNIKVSRKARQNKVKTLIKKKVPLEKRTVILGV